MSTYNYRAVNDKGRTVRGILEAKDEFEAKAKLQDRGLLPVKISQLPDYADSILKIFRRKPDIKSITVFCRQLAIITSSGVNILRGLEILKKQISNKKMKSIVSRIYEDVQKGNSLSEAMAGDDMMLPPLLVNMISVGEVSGNLDEVLEQMTSFYERESFLKEKVKTAMTYPLILTAMAVLILILFIYVVFPQILSVINETGGELPGLTVAVLGFVGFLRKYFLFVLLLVLCLIGAVKIFVPENEFNLVKDKLFIRIPIVGINIRNVVTARFMRSMWLLTKGGIPLLLALETVEKAIANEIVRQGIREARENIKKGEILGDSLASCNFFDPMAVNMINVGEETGEMEYILETMADYYDKESEIGISRMMAMIEPMFTIIIGLLIGFLLVSMVLPLFNMVSGIGQIGDI